MEPVENDGHFSLSLLHVKVQESPPIYATFYFSPLTFDFCFSLDFGCISFDLVRLGPPISIDWMAMFQFGPPSFNFRIRFKLFNKYST